MGLDCISDHLQFSHSSPLFSFYKQINRDVDSKPQLVQDLWVLTYIPTLGSLTASQLLRLREIEGESPASGGGGEEKKKSYALILF